VADSASSEGHSTPVRSLSAAKNFHCNFLGATVGRDNEEWSDILLFGHQIALHKRPSEVQDPEARGVRHFGVILPWVAMAGLGSPLTEQGCSLLMEPAISHVGTERKQGKILLCDPSDNFIEIKVYVTFLSPSPM